ncbi:MAG: GNAT family N-acetyltransferase [Fibrobacterota bacterium]
MKLIEINKENIDNEHICCAIGNDKTNKKRAESKKKWMQKRFEEGLIFKRIDDRGKMFIEYMPVEKCWKPVKGKNQLIINCLWVSGKFKKQGIAATLLDECIKDARSSGKDGICVISSGVKKPFLTDKSFFIRNGFKTIEKAPPYFELLYLDLSGKGKAPHLSPEVSTGKCGVKEGFHFLYSDQCPFMEEYVNIMAEALRTKNISSSVEKLKSSSRAQKSPCAFGTLGIFYKGNLITHELIPPRKLDKFIEKVTEK